MGLRPWVVYSLLWHQKYKRFIITHVIPAVIEVRTRDQVWGNREETPTVWGHQEKPPQVILDLAGKLGTGMLGTGNRMSQDFEWTLGYF